MKERKKDLKRAIQIAETLPASDSEKTSDIWRVTGTAVKRDGSICGILMHVHGLSDLPPIQAEVRAKARVIAEIWKDDPDATFKELNARPF